MRQVHQFPRRAIASAVARYAGEVPYRQENRERQDRDDYAQKHDENRLDLRRQRLDFVVDLALIELGDLEHQVVEFTGLIANGDHLQHDRREDSRGRSSAQHAFTALDAIAHLLDTLRDVVVVDHAGDGRQALYYRHAALDGQ